MRDLWSMQKYAVLNDPTHLVTGVRLALGSRVKEVSVDGGYTVGRTSTHGTWSLKTPVEVMVRKINGERVLSSTEGKFMYRCRHAIRGSAERA
jgi:hypothetical protein